ncbi:MarR family winged helix-turn-helix transcriptional regulator [Pseudoclavibacter soli]|uniref:MarR family winged helix-turn-helix transcriptional regulator n=1 Tax=Pseudoclavibacter soli TaxID=452623 RepID=UPI000412A41A|nr:MarR family transcriptional regulator [Pseudoclavibacter soli]
MSTAADRAAVGAWESLLRAQVALWRRFGAEPIWSELSMKEYDVLYTLAGSASGLRLSELVDAVLAPQPSLSRMVDRLVARGLVVKQRDADDARGVRIQLTDAGRAAQRRVGRAHARNIAEVVGGALDEAELANLSELCRRLRTAVTAEGAKDAQADRETQK